MFSLILLKKKKKSWPLARVAAQWQRILGSSEPNERTRDFSNSLSSMLESLSVNRPLLTLYRTHQQQEYYISLVIFQDSFVEIKVGVMFMRRPVQKVNEAPFLSHLPNPIGQIKDLNTSFLCNILYIHMCSILVLL